MKQKIQNLLQTYGLTVIFLVALVGMLGSLYASEVLKEIPCNLCWWQRVWLFPIVFIAGVGVIAKDTRASLYITVLSIIGFVFALYQNVLQANIITGVSETCGAGTISCVNPTILLSIGSTGVSVEFLSLLAFLVIALISTLLSLIVITTERNKEKENA